MKNNSIKNFKILIILLVMITGFSFAENVFAIEIPIFSLILSENSSGYICSGNSIGCSSLGSIYKVEKRDEYIYVCPSNSIGNCSPLNTIYKTSKSNQDTTYICPSNSLGNCSAFNVLYKINKRDENVSYVCSGDSIGNCSIFNVLYKINKYNTDTTFVCPGDSIGNCSVFNVLYKFKKTDTVTSEYSGIDYNDQIKEEQDKIIQLEREKQKITEDYLKALDNLNTPQYTCPINSTKTGDSCTCNLGYVISGEQCISNTKDCQNIYGNNVAGTPGNSNNSSCSCVSGYEWNTSLTTCVQVKIKTVTPLSAEKPIIQENSFSEKMKVEKDTPIKKITVKKENPEKETTKPLESEEVNLPREEVKAKFFTKVFDSIKNFFRSIFR